jgi:hypothetical protein
MLRPDCVQANIMKKSDGLFLESCQKIAKQYPSIKYDEVRHTTCGGLEEGSLSCDTIRNAVSPPLPPPTPSTRPGRICAAACVPADCASACACRSLSTTA